MQYLDFGEKTEKTWKMRQNNAWPGIWQETLKKLKNENCTLQDLEYGEKTDIEEKEKLTQQDMKYGEKHRKTCEMRHTHLWTWYMVRKLTNEEKEKLTQQDMKYGEKH